MMSIESIKGSILRDGSQQISVRLTAKEGATGRPDEVILALGGRPESTRIHRTHLVFS